MKPSAWVFLCAVALTSSCTAQGPAMSEAAFSYFKQGQDLERKGDLVTALQFYNKADSVEPSFMGVLHARGLLRSHLGDYAGAVEDLDKAIQLCADPQQCEVYHGNRAIVHMEQDQMEKACEDWKMAGSDGKGYLKKYCQ